MAVSPRGMVRCCTIPISVAERDDQTPAKVSASADLIDIKTAHSDRTID